MGNNTKVKDNNIICYKKSVKDANSTQSGNNGDATGNSYARSGAAEHTVQSVRIQRVKY